MTNAPLDSPADERPLMDDLSFLLARSNAASLVAGNAALAPFGLRVRSYSVLASACAPATMTQREIAEFLRLDPSQVVPLVDDLEAKGLVDRAPDPRDRRANVITATPAGTALFTAARVAILEAERTTHAALTDRERETLARLLHKTAFPEEG